MVDSGRESDPFAVHVQSAPGRERLLASSRRGRPAPGHSPNPLGADGYPALGERRTPTGSPTASPTSRDPAVAARYAGKHVAVAGKGASAQGVLIGHSPGTTDGEVAATRVSWLLRRPSVGDAFGGGDNDQLEQRGKLGQDARAAAKSGLVTNVTQFRTESVTTQADGRLTIASVNGQQVTDVDEVIVVTGFRPDFTFLSEVRLDLDPALGSARILADQVEAFLGLSELLEAARLNIAAAVVVGVDLVGEEPCGAQGRVEVKTHLGEEGEVGPEPGHDDDLVDVDHPLTVDRGDGEASVGLGGDGLGAELGDVGDQPAVGGCPGVLAELAALLELVVVAATEGVADAGAAQQPGHSGPGLPASCRAAGEPDEHSLGGSALAGDGHVLAGVPGGDRRVGEVGDAVGEPVGVLALAQSRVAICTQRVRPCPGAGGIDDAAGEQPLVAGGSLDVYGERVGLAAGVNEQVAPGAATPTTLVP